MENIINQVTFTSDLWKILLPLILVAGDVLCGWLQASINHTLDSTKMRTGLFRKFGEIVVLVIAYVVGSAINQLSGIYVAVAIYISLMEAISIMENLDQAGVPLPKWLLKRLKKVKDVFDDDENDKEDK